MDPTPRAEINIRGAMRHESRSRVGGLASEQVTVVAARQLRRLEISRDAVKRRVAAKELYPMWEGAYCVGHEPLGIEPWIAAGALLSEGLASARSAAHLWGWRELLDYEPVEVTSVRKLTGRKGQPPSVPALKIAHAQALPRWTRRHGIPVTEAERTVLDCCAVLPYREARRLTNQALVSKQVTIPSLVAELDANPGRRGSGVLKRILVTAKPTRSEAEDMLVALLHDHAIEGFETNVDVEGVGELDAYCEQHAFAVEVDSRTFHDNPLARADDRAKDARARARGIHVLRLRWKQLTVERPKTAARILAERDRADRAGPRAPALSAAGGC